MKKRIQFGLVLAIVGSLTAVSPAFAAPYTGDPIVVGPDTGTWYWDDLSQLSMSNIFTDTWSDTGGDSNTWNSTNSALIGSDNTSYEALGCASAEMSVATDGSGDQILVCAPQIIDNGDGAVSVQVENRFFSASQTWRQRFIVTNNGTAAVHGQVLAVNYAARQGDSTALSYTSSAGPVGDWATEYDSVPDVNTTPADLTWVTDDRTGHEDAPVVKYAVGRLGSPVLLADDNTRGFVSGGQGRTEPLVSVNNNTNSYFELPPIAAGSTVEIITLARVFLFSSDITDVPPFDDGWQTATFNATQLAIADTGLESDAVVFAGVADRARVLNWTPTAVVPPVVEPVLATTGGDSASLAGFAGLAALAMVAGAGVLFARRRRTARNSVSN